MDTWLVATPVPKHPVALLTRLRSEQAKEDAPRARFVRRANEARRLRHPRLLEVLDARVVGGFPVIVSARPPRRALDQILRRLRRQRSGVPPLVVCSVLRDILRALVHVHEAGIAHGAIRANNVYVDDFGFAKIAPIGMWASGRGDDLHDVGSIALAMMTGGTVAAEGPGHLRRLRPDLPRWLIRIVCALVANDLRERPTSAADVLTSIEHHAKREGWLQGRGWVVRFLEHVRGAEDRPLDVQLLPRPIAQPRGRTVVVDPVRLSREPSRFFADLRVLARGYVPLMMAAIVTGVVIGAALM